MVFLQQGSSGNSVRNLQAMLNHVMSTQPGLVADGIFGAKTRSRVVEFQSKVKIGADGIVGPITGKMLLSATMARLVEKSFGPL
jgi:peptidoglycan hydrolase-like protein with peptidoglycan-binding domain